MSSEIISIQPTPIQNLTSIELPLSLLEDECSLEKYTKLPLSRLPALGTAFEPLASAVQTVVHGSGSTSGLYRVTIPKGTHLAEFKNGAGNLGAVLDANNKLSGQAVLNPLVCNPATVFMAAALASVDKKLDTIQELQQEIRGSTVNCIQRAMTSWRHISVHQFNLHY